MPFCKKYSYLCERVRYIILIEKVLNAWVFKLWAIIESVDCLKKSKAFGKIQRLLLCWDVEGRRLSAPPMFFLARFSVFK